MNKRMIGLALFGVLAFGLAGCGKAVPPETVQPETTAAETAVAETTACPTEAATEPAETTEPTQPDILLELDAESITLTAKGETAELYSGEIDPDQIFWTSGDPGVVWTHGGTVLAVGPGETTVWAEYGGQKAVCQVVCDVDPEAPMPPVSPDIQYAPVKKPPEAGEYPQGITEEMVMDYLDDVIFMGDSTGYTLYQWELRNRQLGEAAFLVRGGVSINSLITGYRKYFYGGTEQLAEDAVQDAVERTEKKRLYIMLGLNDVPQYGTDHTMELWDTFLNQILEKSPDLEIYLESVLMVRTEEQYEGLTNAELDIYNSRMKEYAESHENIHYVELAEYFKDYTNGLSKAYSYDKIHPSDPGVDVWVRVLKKNIAEEIAETMNG